MGLNDKVSAERVHIGFFGLRNAGKSSVVNAVTGQSLSLVSETKGTTTDPVQKAMELLPIGPVVIIDTPGIDDVGTLGEMRVKRALQVLDKTDIAILVVDADKGLQQADQELLKLFEEKKIPHITVYNKSDLLATVPSLPEKQPKKNDAIYVSAKNGDQIYELKERIGALTKAASAKADEKRILADLIQPEDVVVLVVPIDSAAPKGRLILPQQQTIRDVLESGAISVVTRETELPQTLRALGKKPALVITDSQAFQKVNADTPADVPLTSFSILFARYKGDLKEAVHGAAQLDKLQNCTHHRQCGDIGTVKLPNWIRNYTGKELSFEFTSGGEFPEDLSPYALVVHCGGCMLNDREMKARIARAVAQIVPITNYGICIAQVHGILRRSVEMFGDVSAELQ